MSRPLSEAKRLALIEAAIVTIAEHGLAATTILIAQRAKVSQGTLFTYFPDKADLFRWATRVLREEITDVVTKGLAGDSCPRDQILHMWRAGTSWAVAFPNRRRAFDHLCLSEDDGDGLLAPRLDAVTDAIYGFLMHSSLGSQEFFAFKRALVIRMGAVTVDFMVGYPERAEEFQERGFAAIWSALCA